MARRLFPLARRLRRRLAPARLRATVGWLRRLLGEIRRRRREDRLTVGVEINPFWEELTGVGWYLHQLLAHLGERDDLRIRLYGLSLVGHELDPPKVPVPQGPALEWVSYDVPDDLALPAPWLAWLLRRLEPLLIAADGNRVLFAPNYLLSSRFGLAQGALVATLHDLTLWRLPWAVRPDTREALVERLERTLFTAVRLIAPSVAVREELIEGRGVQPDRARAIHHGPGQMANVAPGDLPPGIPPSFALFVGTLEPRKNLPTLLRAWRILRWRRGDVPLLVVCGGYGWRTEEIRREVEAGEREGWLRHLGYVQAGELAALYHRALLLALPSLYEGFGLPVVEALWAGTPVVLSDIPVLHEVAGDAALYAPSDSPEAWADQVARLLDDEALRQDLAARGRARATRFDWRRTARETAEVFQEAAALG